MGFSVTGFYELEKELDQLGKIDEYAPELLEAAVQPLEKELKGQVQRAANRGYATGELASSIKACKPGKNSIGHYIAVTAKAKRPLQSVLRCVAAVTVKKCFLCSS